ncbi:dienelactone hydrolase family protein [Alloacidobacterium dinghuense]|uniref:Dienelactone hydrolase family protein n=1 Tax=Alloacidobacterium dinghuense TaxID=2763107 RepID=A0A7G8BEQ9_9BACT|nr:dienelactone hydrolase family protein [Alloacidobacterium dinghuense]QNI31029.1 dienelactone hydrolase family protein [Alloacidobacterium dinghuense]
MVIKDDLVVDVAAPTGPMRTYFFHPASEGRYPGVILYSEIFQLTAPIRRFASFIAGHRYLVAVPEVYHELETAGTVLAYDQAGADKGNEDKYAKELSSYDGDAKALIEHMPTMAQCNGRLGTIGICLGGHLAFRTAMNPEISAAACFYATDLHSGSLGKGKNDNSLARAGEIKGELFHIWGRQDPHVPLEGRIKIKARLDEVGANYQWMEVNGAHAFMRDEGYRYDPELEYQCKGLVLSLLHRRLYL